jgi:1-acyl-sn-glycerol-3-phosphate acyltransferase
MKQIKWYQLILGRVYALYMLLIFILLLLPAFLLFASITLFYKKEKKQTYYHIAFQVWMDIYLPLIFCPVKRKGLHYFEKGKSYIVVLNHNSLMDIPVSSPGIPPANKTLGKDSFAKIPLFGFIYKCGSILVNRSNARSKAESMIKMKNALKEGISICLYPEGTRNKSEAVLLPFHDGAFKLAITAKAPIIVGAIKHTKEILPANGPIFYAWPHRITLEFAPAILYQEHEKLDALKEKCNATMLALLNK